MGAAAALDQTRKPFHLHRRMMYRGDLLLVETGDAGSHLHEVAQQSREWVADLIAGPFSAADDNVR
jgi:hypothetical protein